MIFTDFAPNESWDDALLSLRLLFQPWRWKNGNEKELVKQKILTLFNISRLKFNVSLFLTGRSALYNLLKSFNLPKGSEVLVQAFTCEAVVLPIIQLGLKPVYIDIESETYSIYFNKLTSKLVNRLTKVLILQHTFGLTPKYRKDILRLAQEKGLIVIEDLAHGFNPSIFKPSGFDKIRSQQTLRVNNKFFHFYLFSFGRSKLLSSVFGGAIISSPVKSPSYQAGEKGEVLNGTMRLWKNPAYPSYFFIFRCLLYKPLTMLIKSTYDIYLGKILHYFVNRFGILIPEVTQQEKKGQFNSLFNKAYPNALSILLLHQLNKFDRIQKQRRKISGFYFRHFGKRVKRAGSESNNDSGGSRSDGGLIRFPLLIRNRDKVLLKAAKQNIFLGKWYDQAVAPKDLDLDRVEYKAGSCPVAEDICKKIINLPTNISQNEAERVVRILNDVI